jgi:hypothetical protein
MRTKPPIRSGRATRSAGRNDWERIAWVRPDAQQIASHSPSGGTGRTGTARTCPGIAFTLQAARCSPLQRRRRASWCRSRPRPAHTPLRSSALASSALSPTSIGQPRCRECEWVVPSPGGPATGTMRCGIGARARGGLRWAQGTTGGDRGCRPAVCGSSVRRGGDNAHNTSLLPGAVRPRRLCSGDAERHLCDRKVSRSSYHHPHMLGWPAMRYSRLHVHQLLERTVHAAIQLYPPWDLHRVARKAD